MNTRLALISAALLLTVAAPVLAADDDSDKMKIEKIIADCEDTYSEDKYPDADERNKLIDKCIEEKSPSSSQQE